MDEKEKMTEEATEPTPPEVTDKPRRGRKSKAQLEAEQLAAKTGQELQPKVNPEIIVDTETDSKPDVENAPAEDSIKPTESAELTPEIVADTPEDSLPDVIEPKAKKVKKVYPSGEAIEAFEQKEASNDPNSLVGKSFILTVPTPMFRGRHASMRIKPYQGLFTVTEDDRQGFTKVKYSRPEFGMCESYLLTSTIPIKEDAKDDKKQETVSEE